MFDSLPQIVSSSGWGSVVLPRVLNAVLPWIPSSAITRNRMERLMKQDPSQVGRRCHRKAREQTRNQRRRVNSRVPGSTGSVRVSHQRATLLTGSCHQMSRHPAQWRRRRRPTVERTCWAAWRRSPVMVEVTRLRLTCRVQQLRPHHWVRYGLTSSLSSLKIIETPDHNVKRPKYTGSRLQQVKKVQKKLFVIAECSLYSGPSVIQETSQSSYCLIIKTKFVRFVIATF